MIRELFSIKDLKVNAFAPVVSCENAEVMRRMVTAACAEDGSTILRFHKDYIAFRVGYQDSETGSIEPIDPPEFCFSVTEIADHFMQMDRPWDFAHHNPNRFEDEKVLEDKK